jgi:hypothetical protein
MRRDEAYGRVVAEPGVIAARGLKSTLRMAADSLSVTRSDADQCVGGMPAEVVNGKHQTRFVSMKQIKCAPVLLPNTTGGDDIREIEIRLGL